MSASDDTNALNFVRRALAERRQSRPSSSAAAAATSASGNGAASSHLSSSTAPSTSKPTTRGRSPFTEAVRPQPPSPSSAAQFLAETTDATAAAAASLFTSAPASPSSSQQQQQKQQREEEEMKAYWAWLAATAEQERQQQQQKQHADRRDSHGNSLCLRSPKQQQQHPRDSVSAAGGGRGGEGAEGAAAGRPARLPGAPSAMSLSTSQRPPLASSQSMCSAVASPKSATATSNPRRISYYAGFLPETLDREERAAASSLTQRGSIAAPTTSPGVLVGEDGVVVPVLDTTPDREGESVWGGATVSSFAQPNGDGGGTAASLGNTRTSVSGASRSRRRTTLLSANFAGSVSGTSASMSRTHSVTFDETLAEAMLSTSNRMKVHQQQQKQQQQQLRRRRSASGVLLDQGRSNSLAGAEYALEGGVEDEKGRRRCAGETPPSLVPSPPESAIPGRHYKRNSNSLTDTVDPARERRPTSTPTGVASTHVGSVKPGSKAKTNGEAKLIGESERSDGADVPPSWQRHSTPSFSFNTASKSGSLTEHERALTWADGMLPPLPDAVNLAGSRGNLENSSSLLLSQPSQFHQQRKASTKVFSTCSPPAPSLLTDQSSDRRSSLGRSRGSSALIQTAHAMNGAKRNSNRSNNSASQCLAADAASNTGSDAQLSHHQLTEAFYGSYKGGKMARDAYLFFISQQQQQQQQQQTNQKRKSSAGARKASVSGGASARKQRSSLLEKESSVTPTPQRTPSAQSNANRIAPAAGVASASQRKASSPPPSKGMDVIGGGGDRVPPPALPSPTKPPRSPFTKPEEAHVRNDTRNSAGKNTQGASLREQHLLGDACTPAKPEGIRRGQVSEAASLMCEAGRESPHTPQPDSARLPSHRRPPRSAAPRTTAANSAGNAFIVSATAAASVEEASRVDLDSKKTCSAALQAGVGKESKAKGDTCAEKSISSPVADAPSNVPSESPADRLAALWQRSTRIYQQSQAQSHD